MVLSRDTAHHSRGNFERRPRIGLGFDTAPPDPVFVNRVAANSWAQDVAEKWISEAVPKRRQVRQGPNKGL